MSEQWGVNKHLYKVASVPSLCIRRQESHTSPNKISGYKLIVAKSVQGRESPNLGKPLIKSILGILKVIATYCNLGTSFGS